jgi:O-antigen ligase
MMSERRESVWLLAAVLCLLQLGSIFAWHRYPQTVFYNEFISAALVVALGACVVFGGRTVWRISPLQLALLALMAVVVLWWGLGGAGLTATLGMLEYLALLLAVVVFVSLAAERLGRAAAVDLCAWGMLLCAAVQCLCGGLQLAGVSSPGWVMAKLMNSAFGNIAQENHYADLLWLGLVSVLHLWLRKRLPMLAAVPALLAINVFAALSVSRAVWLYTLAVPLVALLYTRGMAREARRSVWIGVGTLFALSVATQVWLAFGGAQSALAVTSAIDRAGEGGSNGQRLFDWTVAIKTALSHPLSGVGPGMYSWQTALATIGLPPENYVRIGENAHNTVLHLAAEFGLVFLVLLAALFGAWLWRRWREEASLETLWGLGILAVLLAHSLVEYPLWYAYFLVPLGCAIALIDTGDLRLPALRFNALWLLLPLLGGAFLLGSTWRDYRVLETAYRTLNANNSPDAMTAARLDAVGASIRPYSLLAPQAAVLRLRAWRNTDLPRVPQIVEVCDEALIYKPQYNTLTACVAAYTFAGRKPDADRINEIVCGAFAPVHSKPFVEYSQKLYLQRNWRLPDKGRCLD